MNSSLARFCRTCGQEISWGDELNSWWLNAPKEALEGESRIESSSSFELDAAQTGSLTFLQDYYGYLLIGTERAGLIISNSMAPKKELLRVDTGGERVVAVSAYKKPKENILILTAKDTVYEVDILNPSEPKPIYRCLPGSHNYRAAIDTGAGILVCEHDENSQEFKLNIAGSAQPAVLSYDELSQPVQVSDEYAFFHSSSMCWLYNLYDNANPVTIEASEKLSPEKSSFFSAETQEILIGSDHNIYKISASSPRGLHRLTETNLFQFDYTPILDGQEILVAHQNGLTIINSYNGRVVWEMSQDLKIPMHATNIFKPSRSGNLLVFGANLHEVRTPRLLDVEKRDRLFSLVTNDQLYEPIEPIFGPGNVIVPTGEVGQNLEVFSL